MAANDIKILSFDPGLTTMGWSIGTWSVEKNILTVNRWGVITSIALAQKEEKIDFKNYGRIISLEIMEREVTNLIEQYHPTYIFSEDAFYNPKRPQAYVSLSLCLHTLSRLLYLNYKKSLFKLAPKQIKKIVTGDGTADKTTIQATIISHPNILIKDTKQNQLKNMSEHSADSIAGMYTFCREILPALLMSEGHPIG